MIQNRSPRSRPLPRRRHIARAEAPLTTNFHQTKTPRNLSKSLILIQAIVKGDFDTQDVFTYHQGDISVLRPECHKQHNRTASQSLQERCELSSPSPHEMLIALTGIIHNKLDISHSIHHLHRAQYTSKFPLVPNLPSPLS